MDEILTSPVFAQRTRTGNDRRAPESRFRQSARGEREECYDQSDRRRRRTPGVSSRARITLFN